MARAPKTLPSGAAIGPTARRAFALCRAEALPIALWRSAGGVPQGVISLQPTSLGPAIDPHRARPALAMGAFDSRDGVCELIEADLALSADELMFLDDSGQPRSSPCDERQEWFAARLSDGTELGRPQLAQPREPSVASEADYRALVARAVDAIEAGRFEKVVLSRAERVQLPPGTDLIDVFERLADRYPSAFVALVALPNGGAWLVATPETLLRVDARSVTTMALAGTQPAPETGDERDVVWSEKLKEEQAIVARDVRAALIASDFTAIEQSAPRTARAGNLVHLRSDFSAALDGGGPSRAAAALAGLHPTSAVCGLPREPARQFIRDQEGYERGFYTGLLGPVGAEGAAELYVNLRCAEVIGDVAFLYVGAGVTAQSSPGDEWLETVEKAKTIGRVLATPP